MKAKIIKNQRILNIMLVIIIVSISLLYNYTGYNKILSVFYNNNKEIPIYCVDTAEKKIAISFDAAWGAVINTRIKKIY